MQNKAISHVFSVYRGPCLDKHLEHVVVLSPAGQVQRRVLVGLLLVPDLVSRFLAEQLATNVDVPYLDGRQQGDVVVLKVL